MLFSELVKATKGNRLVGQLLHTKRCFGGHARIGIVVAPGKVDRCGTIAELVAFGHVPSGLEWLDPFFAGIPSISKLPTDNFTVTPSRYTDGPPCPNDIAKREQEAARARAKERRTNQFVEKETKMEIILNLTDRETALLRNSTSDLGTADKDCISLQLKIANAILDAN